MVGYIASLFRFGPTVVLFFASLTVQPLSAEQLRLAVASNFVGVGNVLAADFERRTGHRLTISSGSTGQLYTQILLGAPFDILLSADELRPSMLVNQGLGKAESVFTYACGQLVLISSKESQAITDGKTLLIENKYRRLAIANPETAPFGNAAKQVLQNLRIWDTVRSKLVQGMNVGQAFHFVATRNAELGLVAASQLEGISDFTVWFVPKEMYKPIRQNAVLLKHAGSGPAAQMFIQFLKSEPALERIRSSGYFVDC